MEKKGVTLWMMSCIVFWGQHELSQQWDPSTDKCYNLNSTELIYLYDCRINTDIEGFFDIVCDMFCELDAEPNPQGGPPHYLLISWGLKSDRNMVNMSDPVCLWLKNMTITKGPSRDQHGTRFLLEKAFQVNLKSVENGRIDIIFSSDHSRMVGVANREGNCDGRAPRFSISAIDDKRNTSCKLKIAGVADMVVTNNWFNYTSDIIEALNEINKLFLLDEATFNLVRFEFSDSSVFTKAWLILGGILSIVRLEIINTNFKSILKYELADFYNLEVLSFSRGEIKTIEEGALSHLLRLNNLDISFNALQTIPADVYGENFLQIKQLNMKGNKPGLGRLFFLNSHNKSNSHLLVLRLSETPIGQIKKLSFTSFPNLTDLYLDQCSLNEIEDESFANLSSLINLDLSYNLISSLSGNTFQHLVSLKLLNLRSNRLTTATLERMVGFDYLKSLYVEDDSKRFMHTAIISEKSLKSTSLEHLDLSMNCIRFVSLKLQFILQDIEQVNISMNPFDCNPCPLYLIHSWLMKPNAENPDLFFCSTPNQLKGKEISKLTSSSQNCSKSTYHYVLIITLIIIFVIIMCCSLYFCRDRIANCIKNKKASEINENSFYYEM